MFSTYATNFNERWEITALIDSVPKTDKYLRTKVAESICVFHKFCTGSTLEIKWPAHSKGRIRDFTLCKIDHYFPFEGGKSKLKITPSELNFESVVEICNHHYYYAPLLTFSRMTTNNGKRFCVRNREETEEILIYNNKKEKVVVNAEDILSSWICEELINAKIYDLSRRSRTGELKNYYFIKNNRIDRKRLGQRRYPKLTIKREKKEKRNWSKSVPMKKE